MILPFREDFIFPKLAKFRKNKTLAKISESTVPNTAFNLKASKSEVIKKILGLKLRFSEAVFNFIGYA